MAKATKTSFTAQALAASIAAGACGGLPSTAAPEEPAIPRICADVVGLHPGEKHFQACVDSLTQSMASLSAGEAMAEARRRCLAKGLRAGTSELSECELAEHPRPRLAADATPPPDAGRSYFVVSREVAFKRDQIACARVGFDPAQGEGFADCAAHLRAALARASMPAM